MPKAFVYVPKVMRKPVMGSNTVSQTFRHTCFTSEVREVSKTGPDSQFWRVTAGYGREECVEFSSHCAQSFHICPKGNSNQLWVVTPCLRLSRTCFSSEVCEVSKTGPDSQFWSVMAEYGREGCVEFSSHCAQSFHICPKGNSQTSYGR